MSATVASDTPMTDATGPFLNDQVESSGAVTPATRPPAVGARDFTIDEDRIVAFDEAWADVQDRSIINCAKIIKLHRAFKNCADNLPGLLEYERARPERKNTFIAHKGRCRRAQTLLVSCGSVLLGGEDSTQIVGYMDPVEFYCDEAQLAHLCPQDGMDTLAQTEAARQQALRGSGPHVEFREPAADRRRERSPARSIDEELRPEGSSSGTRPPPQKRQKMKFGEKMKSLGTSKESNYLFTLVILVVFCFLDGLCSLANLYGRLCDEPALTQFALHRESELREKRRKDSYMSTKVAEFRSIYNFPPPMEKYVEWASAYKANQIVELATKNDNGRHKAEKKRFAQAASSAETMGYGRRGTRE
ncbi:hypothetical protein HDU98_001437 [Podochytrium sp. JEL0797]|nr:hypothetical protein HDU98_001437 [Podochytrium sp. JEL0797]